MQQLFYSLAFLACPVGMGLMMWLMMRSNKQSPATRDSDDELARLRAEVDQLRTQERDKNLADSPNWRAM